MTQSTATIQADFDRIALLTSDGGWDHNTHFHDFLLRHVPPDCQDALEIGCGAGALSRRLATRSQRVLALDLSPQMIRLAVERSMKFSNIEYEVADVMTRKLTDGQFDCIATIATLHHLPTASMLAKMKRALKAGGVLLILDLFQSEGVTDAMMSALSMPLSVGLRVLRRGRLRPPREVREAWAEHGRHDSYLTCAQVSQLCAEMLPGAKVRKHLLWRYSVVWKKQS